LSGGTCLYAKTQKGEAHSALKDLARLNPETVKLWNGSKWTQVLKWTKSESKNDKIEIVLRSGERIGATGEHLWPTQRGIVQTKGLMVGDTIESCALPEPDNAKVPEYLTDDLLWLIGLFMAEGSFCGDVVQLSLCVDELPWFDKIKSAVEHLGCTCTYSICGNTLSVRLYGKVINAVIKNFIKYTSAHDVHLDARVWAFPNQALRIITQGYLDGDGHIEKNRIRIGFCRNYYLESDLRTLAARLVATITLNLSTATLNGEKYKAFRGEWRWSRSGHLNEKSRNEIVSIGRSRGRSFWDITVEDEPNLFALASGILTHNCKPNAMPESVKDRCTRSHEYIFLLAKSPHYYFDAEAVREPAVKGDPQSPRGSKGQPKLNGGRRHAQVDKPQVTTRNRRDVWTVSTKPFKGAHFATFPPDLIRPCILAGCKPGGTVLDPFCGSGTTGFVALATGRQFVGIDINPEYCEMAAERIGTTERSK
jgi:hypothetical protein